MGLIGGLGDKALNFGSMTTGQKGRRQHYGTRMKEWSGDKGIFFSLSIF